MELTQAEEILAQHKICRMRQSKKHKFRRAHGMQDTRSLIQCLMSTKATWHWREAAFGEWICSRVSEILFFLLKQTMTMRMSQHGNQWLNHDLVLVGLTQNRWLLGNSLENRGGCALASRTFCNCFWIFVDLQLATGANSAVVLELLSIARYGWSLDVIWTLAKEQFTNKLLRCTYPCLFVRKFRPVTFVFLAIQIRGCSQKLQWKNSQRMWFHWPKHAFSTSPNVPWLHQRCTNRATSEKSVWQAPKSGYSWPSIWSTTLSWVCGGKMLVENCFRFEKSESLTTLFLWSWPIWFWIGFSLLPLLAC